MRHDRPVGSLGLARQVAAVAAFLLGTFLFLGTATALPGVASAQTTEASTTPTQAQLVDKYCGGVSGAVRVGIVAVPTSGVPKVGCLDSSGNLIGNGFKGPILNELAKDEFGTDPGFFNTDPSEFQGVLPTGHLPSSTACSISNFDFGTCIWNPILAGIGTLIVSLAAFILMVAGLVFDFLVEKVILNFGGALHDLGLTDTINYIWATFRDIANILIIGLFIYIAFSIILSIEKFDSRRMIARVLVVAILLNFSLFFTKFTIDVSNLVARQFYVSEQRLNGASLASQSAPVTYGDTATTTEGIAAAFMTDLGLQGVWGTQGLNDDLLKKANGADGGAIGMIIYVIGASIFMLAVAVVLLYGCFLLATRAVLLLLLLFTSSVAFASILLPNSFAKDIWGKWSNSLINTAIFAPLLMLMLAVVLIVLHAGHGTGSLATYLTNPAGIDSVTMLLLFVIGVGLLYGSMRLAQVFSARIAGFDYAGTLPALAGSLGMGAGGVLGRNTIGRLGYLSQGALKKRADHEAGQRPNGRASMLTSLSLGAAGWASKQSYDARNLKATQKVIGQTKAQSLMSVIPGVGKEGAKRFVEGTTKGFSKSHDDAMQREVEKTEKDSKHLEAYNKQTRGEALKASEQAATASESERQAAETAHKAAQDALKEAEKQKTDADTPVVEARNAETVRKQELETAQAQDKEAQAAFGEQLRGIRSEREVADVSGRPVDEEALGARQAAVERQMNESRERVRQAQERAREATAAVERATEAAQQNREMLDAQIADLTARANDAKATLDTATSAAHAAAAAQKAADAHLKKSREDAIRTVAASPATPVSWLRRKTYMIKGDDIAKNVRGRDSKKKKKEEAQFLKDVIDEASKE